MPERGFAIPQGALQAFTDSETAASTWISPARDDYKYREMMFDKLIARIDKTEGRLIVYEGRYKPRITAEMDCLIPFPAKLCQAENDKKSVLVHLVCDDASAWLQDILKYILTGKHPFIRRVKRAFCKASTV